MKFLLNKAHAEYKAWSEWSNVQPNYMLIDENILTQMGLDETSTYNNLIYTITERDKLNLSPEVNHILKNLEKMMSVHIAARPGIFSSGAMNEFLINNPTANAIEILEEYNRRVASKNIQRVDGMWVRKIAQNGQEQIKHEFDETNFIDKGRANVRDYANDRRMHNNNLKKSVEYGKNLLEQNGEAAYLSQVAAASSPETYYLPSKEEGGYIALTRLQQYNPTGDRWMIVTGNVGNENYKMRVMTGRLSEDILSNPSHSKYEEYITDLVTNTLSGEKMDYAEQTKDGYFGWNLMKNGIIDKGESVKAYNMFHNTNVQKQSIDYKPEINKNRINEYDKKTVMKDAIEHYDYVVSDSNGMQIGINKLESPVGKQFEKYSITFIADKMGAPVKKGERGTPIKSIAYGNLCLAKLETDSTFSREHEAKVAEYLFESCGINTDGRIAENIGSINGGKSDIEVRREVDELLSHKIEIADEKGRLTHFDEMAERDDGTKLYVREVDNKIRYIPSNYEERSNIEAIAEKKLTKVKTKLMSLKSKVIGKRKDFVNDRVSQYEVLEVKTDGTKLPHNIYAQKLDMERLNTDNEYRSCFANVLLEESRLKLCEKGNQDVGMGKKFKGFMGYVGGIKKSKNGLNYEVRGDLNLLKEFSKIAQESPTQTPITPKQQKVIKDFAEEQKNINR